MGQSVDEGWRAAIGFHTDLARRQENPHSVLIFPVLLQNLVWVKHPVRGWEVPGGKIEPGETPEAAVRREAFEEAGLQLSRLQWVGEYRIYTPTGERSKWVYLAFVHDIGARPQGSEIVDVRLFHPVLDPTAAQSQPEVSPIMKDEVYMRTWPLLEPYIQTSRRKISACL